MASIGDVIPYDKRQPVPARFLIGQILGLSAGVFAGGFAAEHLSWRVPFIGITVLFIAISVLLQSLNRRLPPAARRTHKGQGPARARIHSEFAAILKLSWARVVLLSGFGEGVFLYGAFAFIATHLHRVHHAPLTRAGAVAMLFGFGGVLFAGTAARLVRQV